MGSIPHTRKTGACCSKYGSAAPGSHIVEACGRGARAHLKWWRNGVGPGLLNEQLRPPSRARDQERRQGTLRRAANDGDSQKTSITPGTNSSLIDARRSSEKEGRWGADRRRGYGRWRQNRPGRRVRLGSNTKRETTRFRGQTDDFMNRPPPGHARRRLVVDRRFENSPANASVSIFLAPGNGFFSSQKVRGTFKAAHGTSCARWRPLRVDLGGDDPGIQYGHSLSPIKRRAAHACSNQGRASTRPNPCSEYSFPRRQRWQNLASLEYSPVHGRGQGRVHRRIVSAGPIASVRGRRYPSQEIIVRQKSAYPPTRRSPRTSYNFRPLGFSASRNPGRAHKGSPTDPLPYDKRAAGPRRCRRDFTADHVARRRSASRPKESRFRKRPGPVVVGYQDKTRPPFWQGHAQHRSAGQRAARHGARAVRT